MPVANLLHITQLDKFKCWLTENNIPFRDGKGEYQVIQVYTEQYGWQVVYRRKEMPEHYSLNNKLAATVRKFIDDSRS